MKRERKQLKLTGIYRTDSEGNKVEIDPKKDKQLSNRCAALVMTIETGLIHQVTA